MTINPSGLLYRRTAINRCTQTESHWNKKGLHYRQQNMLFYCKSGWIHAWGREWSHWEGPASLWLLGGRSIIITTTVIITCEVNFRHWVTWTCLQNACIWSKYHWSESEGCKQLYYSVWFIQFFWCIKWRWRRWRRWTRSLLSICLHVVAMFAVICDRNCIRSRKCHILWLRQGQPASFQ